MRLVHLHGHSSYDCEYVALANRLKLPLVTGDRSLARKFPDTAILMEDFIQ